METMSVENSTEATFSSNDMGDHTHTEDLEPQPVNHGDAEAKPEINEEEVRGILQVIAATGKFWHDWDTLKTFLSFRLKQVLVEYPEAQMEADKQSSELGETYSELVRRLDEALLSFINGPPFTLQRLCEILLTASSMYPKLSKLALALEKNLLVTSTLTISSEQYPPTVTQKPDEAEKGSVESSVTHSAPLQNGVEAVVGDQVEERTEAQEIDEDKVEKVDEDTNMVEKVDEDMTEKVDDEEKVDEDMVEKIDDEDKVEKVDEDKAEIAEKVDEDNKDVDMETTEETTVETSETIPEQVNKSEPSGESAPSNSASQ